MDGWWEDISAARRLSDLPRSAVRYVDRLQELMAVPISIISVGPERGQTIVLRKEFLF